MEATLCVVGAGAMGAQIAHQAALHGLPVRLYSRSLNDITIAAPEIVEAVLKLPARTLILDGEAIE